MSDINIDEINKVVGQSLSNVQMKDFLAKNGKKTNLKTYEELANVNDLNELLLPFGRCIILYETSTEPVYGHWCCLSKKTNGKSVYIDFFDSYGYEPDAELNWKSIPAYVRKVAGEDHTHLLYLLDKYTDEYPNTEIYYNPYDYQEKKAGVSTCGRHVITRIMCQELDDDQYKNFIDEACNITSEELKTHISPDQFVSILTRDA